METGKDSTMSKHPTRFERFEDFLHNPPYGSRHRNLLKIARLGRLASVESTELSRLIHEHWDGTDPLTEREVMDAVVKVESEIPLGGDIPEGAKLTDEERRQLRSKLPPPPPPPSPATHGEMTFFERMAAAGRAWIENRPIYGGKRSAALYDLSPVQFPPTDWREQAALMIDLLATDSLGFIFSGEKHSPRDQQHLSKANVLAADIRSGKTRIPPLIIANQLSGSRSWVADKSPAGGHWSMATKREILHCRHAVIEFDGFTDADGNQHPLPLKTQADFWLGVLTHAGGPILPVRSLVYSGSKSIHAIIRLEELQDLDDARRCDFAEYVTQLGLRHGREPCTEANITAAEVWATQWSWIERILCSSQNCLYHCDRACKDITRLTRLAGHLRAETGQRQSLLWLSSFP